MKKQVPILEMADKLMQINAPFMTGVAQKLFTPFDNLCANMKNTLFLDITALHKGKVLKGYHWV